jgi:hypothetical protein
MRQLAKVGDLNGVTRALQGVEDAGLTLDPRTLGIAIEACAQNGNSDLAIHLAEKFGTEERAVRVASFNAILGNLADRDAGPDELAAVAALMQKAGVAGNDTSSRLTQ